jgi:threonine dehydratase
VPVENTPDAREVAADEILKTSGGIFVHPSEDPRVIAGQGTVSLELVAQVKELGHDIDAVIIPVGGGGLASGNTIALRGLLGDTVKVSQESDCCFDWFPLMHQRNASFFVLFVDYIGRTS